MLDQLLEYGRKHLSGIEPGFTRKDVKWAIELSEDGRFLEVHELGDVGEKGNRGRSFDKCPELSQPELVGGSEERSHFLVESAQVVALWLKGDEDEKTLKKLKGKHGYFVRLLRDASKTVPELAHAAEVLEDPACLVAIGGRLIGKKAKPSDKVTLLIGGSFPLERDDWHEWWREFRRSLKKVKPGGEGKRPRKKAIPKVDVMRCFLSGELVKPAATQPKIAGLANVGGLPTGDALICFDKDAFTSYGLSQSANGAVSEVAAAEYRAALNHLIREHSSILARDKAKVVHWFKDKVREEDDPFPWLMEPSEQEERNAQEKAKQLLDAIRSGRRPDLSNNRYYALTLSGAAGRVMVRDWMEGPFERLVENIKSWFSNLSIVRRDGGGLAPDPKFLAVLGATVRDLKDVAPPFVAKMWRAAVFGERIPSQAAAQALARARVDFIQNNPPNHARMGLLRAYLIREEKGDAAMGQYLNEDHPDPAYHCGRLMAVLAWLQHSALGDVGAGVVQRFYAAASSTPALVLGRLTRTSQFHLNKLEPGLAHWYEGRLAEIWTRIKDQVPATLTLEEQTLFALGYYQQLAFNRSKPSDKEK